MPYVIGPACIEVLDGSCVDACPVDCIYEGGRKRYIQPVECIECGACIPVCPVNAITTGPKAEPEWAQDNAEFFDTILVGRTEPLGSPGSASLVGKLDADTLLTSTTPPQPTDPSQNPT